MPTSRQTLPLLGALLLAAGPARADGPPEPANRLIASTFTVVRYNPIGLDQQVALTLRQRIGESDELLFKTRFWSVGAMAAWNPANWSARAEAMVEPIAIFQLRLAYDLKGYFGNFNNLLSSTDPNQVITVEELNAAAARDDDYPGISQVVTVQPTLQIAFGPIGIRNTFGVEYGTWSVRSGDTVVYDSGPDVLRAASGWMLTNSTTAVFLGERFYAGALYQWLNPLGVPGNRVQRVGAIASYTFFDRGAERGWFNKPTVLALALFNVEHRGQRGPIPTAILAFTTESDLLPAAARVPAP